MIRYKWMAFIFLGFLAFILFYLNFDMNGYKGRRELNEQLNALIRNRDYDRLERITDDNYSYDFLRKLPRNVRANHTVYEGFWERKALFKTELDHRVIEVEMVKVNHKLFGPSYFLDHISVTASEANGNARKE